MKEYVFRKLLNEYADFGLDLVKKQGRDEDQGDDPIQSLNVEYVIKSLIKPIGNKNPKSSFFGEVQWGEQDGAIKLNFSPFGGIRVSLRKLTHDLSGEPTWICKKVIEVRHFFDEHPDKLTFKIEENINEMDQQNIDAPLQDFDNLERLVIRIASELKRNTTQRIFIYEGIRRIEENYKYIIHFGVTGHGVQRVGGQKRLDQFAIHVEYSKNTGLIKITGTELGDRIDKHRWQYDPSHFIEYFSPSQKEDEITSAILACFNSY